jgi:hypothetical protein
VASRAVEVTASRCSRLARFGNQARIRELAGADDDVPTEGPLEDIVCLSGAMQPTTPIS